MISEREMQPDPLDEAKSLLAIAKHEILNLRSHINYLAPKAEAYDVIQKIAFGISIGQPQGMSVDVAWQIDQFLTPAAPASGVAEVSA